VTDEIAPVPSKGSKKTERQEPVVETAVPESVLSFDEFVLGAQVDPVPASGLQSHLRATTGLEPRPLVKWQAAMNHYQALA
jgi:hypothetical protein